MANGDADKAVALVRGYLWIYRKLLKFLKFF